MIGRSRERRSFCGGDTFPGRRVFPSAAANLSSRRRRAIELRRGMQRPSGWGDGLHWVISELRGLECVDWWLTCCPTPPEGRRIPLCNSTARRRRQMLQHRRWIDATPGNGHGTLKRGGLPTLKQVLVSAAGRSTKFPTPDAIDRVPPNTQCPLELIEPRVPLPFPAHDAVWLLR